MPRRDRDVIGVIGAGVVGGAVVRYALEQRHEVRIYDPVKGHNDLDALNESGIVFACVPTPYTPGIGFDDSCLHDAVRRIAGSKTVVIKSTVLPGTTGLLQERYPRHRFLFNPEFLREATAYQDFVAPDRQIVGVTDASAGEAERLLRLLPRAPFERVCGAAEAEMAKYVANAFLAIKVSYANEVFDLCARLGLAYGDVREIVAADERIGSSHLDVFDGGYRGYGGKCLPKDSKSLLDLARAVGVEMDVLRSADRVNARLGSEREIADPRRVVTVASASRIAAEEQAA